MNQLMPLQLFKSLSDETRLMIVLVLKKIPELCVCELCEILNTSQPKISRHLAMLKDADILLDRKVGKWVYYRLSHNIPMWAASIVEQAYTSQKIIINSLVKQRYSPHNRLYCS